MFNYNLPHVKISRGKERREWLTEADIQPGAVADRHISREGVSKIRFGLRSERPDTGGDTAEIFYATDETTLYIWDPSADTWTSTTYV